MAIIDNAPCEVCRAQGGDRTGNHKMLYEDGGAYCSRCATYTPPSGEGAPSGSGEEAPEGLTTGSSAPLMARGINHDIAQRYGVLVEYSEVDRTECKYRYPMCTGGGRTGWKVRTLPKQFSSEGMCKGADLIGRELFSPGGKRVLITEGQDDMLAAAQMLSDRYPDYLPVVVSLPFGTTSKLNTGDMEFLNSFDSVYICMDNDDPGHDAVKRLSEVIGDKVRVVKLKEDPNSMLLAGNQRAFVSAYFDASEYRPDGFVTVEDVWADATKMPVAGRDWPWPSLNALTYGRRDGEGAYIGAGVKIGKTQAMLEIVYHTALVQKTKIAVFALEQEPAMTVRKVAGRIKGLPFHRPDGDFTQEQLEAGVKKVDNVVLYKAYGSTAWDEIKAAIRYAVVVQGCKDVIIDPLTRLTTGMDPSDANTELERVADEISSMAKDLGFFYIFFCHLKAPPSGIKSHEEGGKVKSAQFTGSRAMMRACYYMVGLERDKSPDREEVERNTTKFVLLEDRAFGNSGAFDVFYNRDTGAYLEPLVGGSDYADF